MFKKIITWLVATLFFFSSPIHAREFGGKQFPDTVKLPETTESIALNGVGYRKKLFIKVYIGALYLPTKADSRDAAVKQDGPKRVLMHFVYDELSSEKLVNAWNDGFENNLSEDALAALRPRIDEFNAMFSTVKEGDEITLDYIPGTGTRVTIKGDNKGIIEGKDFNDALLDIWLGEEPADGGLKDAMLGQ